jgi:putative nucleotidyltransferase with HDIG domain
LDPADRILVIEDDEIFRKTLVKTLTRENYQVKGVEDGAKAIALFEQTGFDIIISDVRLGGEMDGIETVRRIKENQPDAKMRVIIMTGYSGEEAPIRAIKVGVDDYIHKPFKMESFLLSIKKNSRLLHYDREEKQDFQHLQQLRDKVEVYNDRIERKFKEETSKLSLLFEASEGFTSLTRLEDVLSIIIERVSSVLELDRCSLLLYDEEKEELSIMAHKGLSDEVAKNSRIKTGDMISGWVLRNKEPILVDDIEKDPRFAKNNEEKYYTGSFISVPLIYKGRAIGVLNANNKTSHEKFNEEDFKLIKSLAEQSSIAIESARLYSVMKDMCFQVTSSLTSIIDAKDHYTKNHSTRVAKYAEAIAQALQLPQLDINNIVLACQLHDLGKIGVNEELLTKSGKLTQEEYEQIKRHPQKGGEMLRPLSFLKSLIDLVEQHHERYDGKGYPNGLKGDEIVLGARIISVADSFDAILTERPYSEKHSTEEAINEMIRCKGTQFDPVIVDTFVKILQDPSEHEKWDKIRRIM